MIFEIHENDVIGTLYYDRIPFIESIEKTGLFCEDVIFLLAKEEHLRNFYVYDIVYDHFCFKLYGSIINMLRFRNKLKTLFNLTEDIKRENHANL